MKDLDNFNRLAKIADAVLIAHLERTQKGEAAKAYNRIVDPFFKGFQAGWAKAEQEGSAIHQSILGKSFDDNTKLDVSIEPEKFAEALAAFLCALLTTPQHAIISGNGVTRYLSFTENLSVHNPEFCRLIGVVVRNLSSTGKVQAITSRLQARESAVFEQYIKDMKIITNSA